MLELLNILECVISQLALPYLLYKIYIQNLLRNLLAIQSVSFSFFSFPSYTFLNYKIFLILEIETQLLWIYIYNPIFIHLPIVML